MFIEREQNTNWIFNKYSEPKQNHTLTKEPEPNMNPKFFPHF